MKLPLLRSTHIPTVFESRISAIYEYDRAEEKNERKQAYNERKQTNVSEESDSVGRCKKDRLFIDRKKRKKNKGQV